MTHYICTGGCKGVSEKPGVCDANDCPKWGQPLETCDCMDNKHFERTEPTKEQ